MINWNIVPMNWSSPDFPYLLFTEMEWIGKLSYIANDLDNRTTILTETVDNIVNMEIPAIKDRLDIVETKVYTIENTEIPGIKNRLDIAEGKISTIENTEIPGIKNRLETLEDETKVLLYIPVIPYPVDTTDTRSYTIQLPTGYNVCDVSFRLHGDYATEHEYYSDQTMNIACKNGACSKFDINYAPPGEYGQATYLQHYINLSTNNAEELTISYGKDNAWWTDPTIWTEEGFPDVTRIILKLYKLPNV